MKVRIADEHNYGDKRIIVYNDEAPSQEANLAMVLLEKWGPVCAMPDGEDSAGRAKSRAMTPAETVKHAFDIAAEAMRVARERGLMIALPDLNEINAEKDAERLAKKKAAKANAEY